MDALSRAPFALLVLAVGGILFGTLPLLWILKRMGRFVLRRPQVPVRLSSYFMALGSAFCLLSMAAVCGALVLAFQTWRTFTDRTHVATVKCVQAGPAKLKLELTPYRDEKPEPSTQYELAGDEWQLGGDIVRFRDFLTPLGLHPVHKLSRVEGRWLHAADANRHQATAFDLDGGTAPGFLALYKEGTRGPLGLLIDGAHGQSVSQLPDDRALFDVFLTPNGYIVDKRK